MTTTLDAIVLAGGVNPPDVAAHTGATLRALTPLASRPLFSHVTDALAACDSVGRVFVVGPVPDCANYIAVPPGVSLLDNLTRGLEARLAPPSESPPTPNSGGVRPILAPPNLGAGGASSTTPVLIVTSDIPFLTAEAVNDFLWQAVPLNVDFAYAIVPLDVCKARFPTLKRTTLKLREGQFTGGNLMLINPQFVRNNAGTIAAAYAARKQPLHLAKMLGMGLLARVLLSQTVSPHLLTVAQLEAGASRLLGAAATARAVVSRFAEVGTDIDDLVSLDVAEQMLTVPQTHLL